ncbi:probable WRKY transcription factor 65 [Diospyros lotus]|uniref:probable WRKY transcription factor 65 n=1 Tax=Diospyros lotus TaxID=55363 RepID=UPI00225AB0A5|nr:probable WRKY transcription factor 65 [Diospyros lotus]XP_052201228.1 probable WRKY transcription factor 65 [Diospyros lotus]
MDGRRFSNHSLVNHEPPEDTDNSPENSGDSPRSAMFADARHMDSTSSPKRSKRGAQKRVVTVPIRDVEGSRIKGESAPPSDSWAWRKYGQKPIKGSPYPRGYYRCSSSKGCPARKQVERSRLEPTMMVITYSSEHNHPLPPATRNHHHHQPHHHQAASPSSSTAAAVATTDSEIACASTKECSRAQESQIWEDEKAEALFSGLGEESLLNTYEFKWFSDLESTSSTAMLESPMMASGAGDGNSAAAIFTMGEEEESLFADLGELPECSLVFQRGALERVEEEHRRCNLAPWCGTTG